ncbi:MAG: hypothetical protein HC850_03920 [Rhodomicrobium sp.]|nr:hypothetical protein [Rhodomicrobium sp.]
MTNWPFQPLGPAAAQQTAGGGGPTYTLTADAGSFGVTGQTASPHVARRAQASVAGFAVNGQLRGDRKGVEDCRRWRRLCDDRHRSGH